MNQKTLTAIVLLLLALLPVAARSGNTVQGCTVISLDCVPFAVVHAPVGYAHYDVGGDCQCQNAREYDTAPVGQHFIEFPN